MRSTWALAIVLVGLAPAGCRRGDPPPKADTIEQERGATVVATPPAASVESATTASDEAAPAEPAATSAPAAPATAPPSSHTRWCIVGRVTDANGAPLAEVEIIAHCGIGTLRPTGHAVTDASGEYVLWFGPGVLFLDENSGLQAATISPRKAGMVERNLYRQGDLRMASREVDEAELGSWGPADSVVYPEQRRRVDFTMVPAAAIRGRLVDGEGRPIAGHYVWVGADALPPSSNVLATMTTDDDGRFAFTEIPAGDAWLGIRTPGDVMREVCTETMQCQAARVYEVELVYHAGEPVRLELRQRE